MTKVTDSETVECAYEYIIDESVELNCTLKRIGYKYKQLPCAEFCCENDSYHLGKYLSKGGFSYCFTYQCDETGHQMVAKVSATSAAGKNASTLKRKWTKEVNLMAAMQHDNIVSFYDSMQTDHLRYILMEYLPNNLMREHSYERVMAVPKVRIIMRDIFGGLAYLHSRNIIHRDIKMSNILLTAQKRAKLCDFGMSVQLDENAAAVITMANACGTQNYMPPELCVANGVLSSKADVWSSGVVMYAILIGFLPFARGNNVQVLRNIFNCAYTIPVRLRQGAETRAAVELLQKILVSAPVRRPSADELLNDPFFV